MIIRNENFEAAIENFNHEIGADALKIKKTDDSGCFDCNLYPELSKVDFFTYGFSLKTDSCSVNKLILPRHLNRVSSFAFGNADIRTVVWPDDCTHIPEFAFMESKMEEILNIDCVTYIGRSAFKGSNLRSFHIPDGVEAIPEKCFYATSLSDISGGKNVKEIGSSAFFGCYNLKSFTIPAGVDNLPSECFSRCISLKEVDGLDRIKNFGNHSFFSCHALDGSYSLDAAMDIGEFSFCDTSVKGIDLSRSICGYIGRCAFAEAKIKSFTPGYFPCIVDDSAFDDTPLKKEVVYV